jgi:ABC-type uncharacterized transport system ATPase subunit
MPQPNDYLAIRAWGEMMRRAPTHILAEQELAAKKNAPIDSISYGSKQWVTISVLTNPDARRRIEERLAQLRKENAALTHPD